MMREQISALRLHTYGSDSVPEDRELTLAWKAVKAIAAGRGMLSDEERQLLFTRMSAVGTPTPVIAAVIGWDERSERAEALIPRAGARTWILYEALLIGLCDDCLAANKRETLEAAARAMGVGAEMLDEIIELCREEAELRKHRIELLAEGGADHNRYDLL